MNQKARLYVNQGEEERYKMIDEAVIRGIADTSDNRGTMAFDYDLDGDLDVLVVNHGEVPALYRNDGGNYYDYLRVQVLERNGRESIGAKVWVQIEDDDEGQRPDMMQEIGSSAAFLGQTEATAHFGLGLGIGEGGIVHRVKVQWPPIVRAGSQEVTAGQPGPVPSKDTVETVYVYNVPRRSTLIVHRGDGDAKDGDAKFEYDFDGSKLQVCQSLKRS